MTILQIEHRVADFDRWRTAFESDPVGREEGGVRRYRILRPLDDPNYVVVELEFESASDAEAFRGELHSLWERAREGLGLENPLARVVEVVETREY
ncbi:MAG: hypothetical protein M3123_03885 [Actinomycetota bacterium]|nr:hypothetical protein [Actinomycetota bacterium]